MVLGWKELVERVRAEVPTCDVVEAARRVREDPRTVVIDVREPEEAARLPVPGSVNVPRGLLEFQIAKICGEPDRPILVHCGGGNRAVLAARSLRELGYPNVTAIVGSCEELARLLREARREDDASR